MIHWPFAYKEGDELFPKDSSGKVLYSDVDYVETWGAMEECVTLGLTKSLGLSNFNTDQINRILASCTIKPVNLQVTIGFIFSVVILFLLYEIFNM